jgi:hypothetical protein
MLISGLLTCTMFYALFAPEASLRSTFGEELSGSVAQIVVRNWGALIGLVGIMLIYGAFNDAARRLVLMVAGASKIVFISLVLMFGQQFLKFQAGTAILVDGIMVLIFVVFLVSTRKQASV